MTDTNKLPPLPEFLSDTNSINAFVESTDEQIRDAFRAYALQARAQVQGELSVDQMREMLSVHKLAIVPMRATHAMLDAMSDDDWQWSDLLAAAKAITESEYDWIDATPRPAQATQATPSIPSDGPSTYAQRFTAAVAVICGVTPPAALVCDWINKEERHDDLQQWVGSYAPGWVQNIAVLDAAHQMADQPTEGGNHEPAQQPATGEPVAYVDRDGFIIETGLLLAPGTKLYTTPQPAQATQAGVTDSMIREAFLANGFTIKDGHSDLKPYVYAAARAILALRPERAPMTTDEISDTCEEAHAHSILSFMKGVRAAEAHHFGITTQPKGGE